MLKPVKQEGGHALQIGQLLRADMPILNAKGLHGIDASFRIRVSTQIREQYRNGNADYAVEGEQRRTLSKSEALWPARDLLKWRL